MTTLPWPRPPGTQCCDKVGILSASRPPVPDRGCPPPHSSCPGCTARSSSSALTWRRTLATSWWQNMRGRWQTGDGTRYKTWQDSVKSSLVCRLSSPCWHKRDERTRDKTNCHLLHFTHCFTDCAYCSRPFYRLSLSVFRFFLPVFLATHADLAHTDQGLLIQEKHCSSPHLDIILLIRLINY